MFLVLCGFVELKLQSMFSSGFQSKALETKFTLCCICICRYLVETKSDLTVSNKCQQSFSVLPALCISLGLPYWGDSKGVESGDTEKRPHKTATGEAYEPII